MLNFRNTNLLFSALLVIFILVELQYGLPFYVYIILGLSYTGIVGWGCYHVGSNFFIKTICSSITDQQIISISFDDGPVEVNTLEILAILKKEEVKATFFCIGHRIPGNELIVKKILEDGHIIGNHSYSHDLWFDLYGTKKMQDDLKQMDMAMKKATGLEPKLFRPPYGVTNPNLAKAIQKGGYTAVGWNVRSLDTVIKDGNQLLKRINKGIKPGAVFLFHDTSKTMLHILPQFIQEVKKRGYQIIPLNKMLDLQPYA